jgi:hypothetical protein
VLIHRDQSTQRLCIQPLERDDAHRTIAGMDLVFREKFDAFGRQFFCYEL